MWFVYLLRCADGSLYCGATNDLDKRVAAHEAGRGAKYTRSRLPVELVWYSLCVTKSRALKQEFNIKRLDRKGKMLLIKFFRERLERDAEATERTDDQDPVPRTIAGVAADGVSLPDRAGR